MSSIFGGCFCEAIRFKVTRGELHWHRSSPGVTRGLCANCGSTISYENTARQGEIDITLNALDNPNGPIPKAHIWTEDKQPWMSIGDDLPVYEKNVVAKNTGHKGPVSS